MISTKSTTAPDPSGECPSDGSDPVNRRPLRILQVATHFPGWGGTELHLLNLSDELRRRGHDVTIAVRPGRFVEAEAQRRGFPTIEATVEHQSDHSAWRALWTGIGHGRFDVVHAHWRQDYMLAPTIARLRGVRAIFLSHHSPHPLKKKEVPYYPRVYKRMIALSESVRQMLLGLGLPPDFVTTIHHGTDVARFEQVTRAPSDVRAEWGVPPGAFVVGIAGRVSPEKGILDFLEAIKQMPNEPIWAVVIGDGLQMEEIKAFVTASGLQNRVRITGFLSDVNNAINALDALILASTWAEPCAAVVQQAMALSKPVIGTRIGGTPEMIADKETGLLVAPGTPDEIAAALRTLMHDSTLRECMGCAGHERVHRLFTQQVMVNKIENLYLASTARTVRS